MNQDFRTLWKSSESFLKFETFGTFSTPELFESFQNQNLEEEFTDIYKLSHESCSENKTLFSHKINLIAEYHSSLNQSLSKHAPRKLFIYLSSRQSETGSPTGGAISFKAVDPPLLFDLEWPLLRTFIYIPAAFHRASRTNAEQATRIDNTG